MHVDEDALSAGLVGLRAMIERGEHPGPVVKIGPGEPGMTRVQFASGETWDCAHGDTAPHVAEGVYAVVLAGLGLLAVTRH